MLFTKDQISLTETQDEPEHLDYNRKRAARGFMCYGDGCRIPWIEMATVKEMKRINDSIMPAKETIVVDFN
jgi:hypothetical protein